MNTHKIIYRVDDLPKGIQMLSLSVMSTPQGNKVTFSVWCAPLKNNEDYDAIGLHTTLSSPQAFLALCKRRGIKITKKDNEYLRKIYDWLNMIAL